MTRVYIAAPYSVGDQVLNTRRVIDVAEKLITMGYVPFVPHLYHLWHIASPHGWRYWLDLDCAWLEACNVMLRLSGHSAGCDEEIDYAGKHGIPIVYSAEELVERFPPPLLEGG